MPILAQQNEPMKNYQTEFLSQHISNLRISQNISRLAYQAGNDLYLNNQCVLLSREGERYSYTIEDNYQDFTTEVLFSESEKRVELKCSCKAASYCSHKVAALLQLHEDLSQELTRDPKSGMKYTREGMIKRVMAEREEKAHTEKYQLDFADNIYGEHFITNQRNKTYTLTFYDFEQEQGYCSCPDHQTNKLGTCKHLIYAFDEFKKRYAEKPLPEQNFPFLEVFLHPLKDYRISWFYPGILPAHIQVLLNTYFKEEQLVSDKDLLGFRAFIREAQNHKFIHIRPEVLAKVQKAVESQSLKELKAATTLNFNNVYTKLYPFQTEGVEFIVFTKRAILADEMGLGKTLQAIVAAQFKKELFNFRSALVVCPDSLISHWKNEIQKVLHQQAVVVRSHLDLVHTETYFKLISFEELVRLSDQFEHFLPDMLIIDETQKISNFDSDLVRILRKIEHRHMLILTDSNPENHLMQFYTMVGFIDNQMLTPLWEFSYQHCLFDSKVIDKIVGYYNQENLVKRLSPILLRREKDQVFGQLRKIHRQIVPVNLNDVQQQQQLKMAEEALFLLNKKLKSAYDWQKIAQLFVQMKNMSSLVFLSKQSHGASAKFIEFRHFMLEKLNLTVLPKKIIVFAEKEDARRQLVRFFKDYHIPVVLFNPQHSAVEIETMMEQFSKKDERAVLLMREGLIRDLPLADTYLYFDLSANQQAVEERLSLLQRQNTEHPPSVVQLLSRYSLEEMLFLVLQENEGFYNELNAFIGQRGEVELSPAVLAELGRRLQNLLTEKGKTNRKTATGQTSLFPAAEEVKPISLSGEEHKAFEKPVISKNANTPAVEKLVQDAHRFLSGLYALQTGKELPWKENDIEVKMEEKEIVLRIKTQ